MIVRVITPTIVATFLKYWPLLIGVMLESLREWLHVKVAISAQIDRFAPLQVHGVDDHARLRDQADEFGVDDLLLLDGP